MLMPMATAMTTTARGDDEVTLDDLKAIAALLPGLLRVEGHRGDLLGCNRTSDGSIQMPYVSYAPAVNHFIDQLVRRERAAGVRLAGVEVRGAAVPRSQRGRDDLA